jgi:hypothetical protein
MSFLFMFYAKKKAGVQPAFFFWRTCGKAGELCLY